MKQPELMAFLKDLTTLMQENYNDTLDPCRQGESEADCQFRLGQNFAYYDALDLLHAQMISYGIAAPELEPIVPELGQPALTRN
jgi:hypothetical protein